MGILHGDPTLRAGLSCYWLQLLKARGKMTRFSVVLPRVVFAHEKYFCQVGREFIGLCFEFPLPPMRWRGDDGLGALIGTLSNPNASARAFDFVDARKRLIGASFVEPNHPPRVSTFQQRVQAVLQPYWM